MKTIALTESQFDRVLKKVLSEQVESGSGQIKKRYSFLDHNRHVGFAFFHLQLAYLCILLF